MTFKYWHLKWNPDHPDPAVQILALPDPIRTGTLCFFGHWIGRPMDNLEVPLSASWKDDCLTIVFENQWYLRVWEPRDFSVDGRTFQIRTASRLLYGRRLGGPEKDDSTPALSFLLEKDVLTAKFGDGSTIRDARSSEPAVGIH